MPESMESVRAARVAQGRREECAVLIRRLLHAPSSAVEHRAVARSGTIARLLAQWAAEAGGHR